MFCVSKIEVIHDKYINAYLKNNIFYPQLYFQQIHNYYLDLYLGDILISLKVCFESCK